MPNIFLKNMTGDLVVINDVINIDELILYLCKYLNISSSSEELIIFNEEDYKKEISVLEEGKIYNFLIREIKDFKVKLLFDSQSTDVDNNKIYNKFIIQVFDEIFPFYNYDDMFYDYKNIDVLDRFSLFENIRFRDPYIQGMNFHNLIELYFQDLPWYDRKYIEKKISEEWENIENDDYDAYDDYEDHYNDEFN